MKVILLMGFALCFGMSGYGTEETVTGADGLGSGPGKARLYEKRKTSMGAPLNAVEDPLQNKKAKTENSPETGSSQGIRYSPTRIMEVPTSPQRGFSVHRSQKDRKNFQAFTQMSSETSNVLYSWLNSTDTLNEEEVLRGIETLAKAYQEQLDVIDLQYKEEISERTLDQSNLNRRRSAPASTIRLQMIDDLNDLWYGFDGITPSNADTTRAREILILLGSTPPGEAPSETSEEE